MPRNRWMRNPLNAAWMRTGGFIPAYDGIANLVHIYEPARRTLTSYTGSLVRLRRASDNAERDFGYDLSGNLKTSAIAAWAGGLSYVVTIYDQVGNDDITQGVVANQPLFTANAQNGHAGLTFDASDWLRGAYTISGALSQPFSIYCVAQLDAGEVNNDVVHTLFVGDDAVNQCVIQIRTAAAPDTWRAQAGILINSVTATDASWILWVFLVNGLTSNLYRNNVSIANGNAGAENPDGLTWGALNTDGTGWLGLQTALIVADPSHSDAQRLVMQTAINDYWGVY